MSLTSKVLGGAGIGLLAGEALNHSRYRNKLKQQEPSTYDQMIQKEEDWKQLPGQVSRGELTRQEANKQRQEYLDWHNDNVRSKYGSHAIAPVGALLGAGLGLALHKKFSVTRKIRQANFGLISRREALEQGITGGLTGLAIGQLLNINQANKSRTPEEIDRQSLLGNKFEKSFNNRKNNPQAFQDDGKAFVDYNNSLQQKYSKPAYPIVGGLVGAGGAIGLLSGAAYLANRRR